MNKGFRERLEELSREQRRTVGSVSSQLGIDGSSHLTFEDLVPRRKKRKKRGRNLTIRERLLRAYER